MKRTLANVHTSGGGAYPGQFTHTRVYYTFGDVPGQPGYGQQLSSTTVVLEDTLPTQWRTVWSRTRNGTPGYFHLGRYAPLPVHHYQFDLVKIRYAVGDVRYRVASGSDGVMTSLMIDHINGVGGYTAIEAEPFSVPSSKTDELDRQARTKLLTGLKSQTVNLAQMYAERKQTSNLVLGTLRTLRSAGTALHAGAFRDLYQVLGLGRPSYSRERFLRELYWSDRRKCIEGTWLELQYGWKPLLQDIHGSMEALVRTQFAKPLKYKATAKFNVNDSRIIGQPGLPGPTITHEASGFQVVKYVVEYRTTNDVVSSAAQLGLLNPAQLVWELLPYSFVVDWFLPVGQALSQLDSTAGLSFFQGTKTVFTKGTTKASTVSVPTPSVYGPQGYDGLKIGTREEVHMTRDVMSQFPAPALPVLKNPFSSVHVANAIALLATSFKR